MTGLLKWGRGPVWEWFELLDLEWRDVDLAAGRLRVRHSKTGAGTRYVGLLPVLRDELSAHKATSANTAPNAYVSRPPPAHGRTAGVSAAECSGRRSSAPTRDSPPMRRRRYRTA